MGELVNHPAAAGAPGVTIVDAARLEQLLEVERRATLLATAVYQRRARGHHKAPLQLVDDLVEVLLARPAS